MSWWDWFVEDYARYWYAIGAIALDAFVCLGLAEAYHVKDAVGTIGIVSVLIALSAGEVVLFRWLWPEAGFMDGED